MSDFQTQVEDKIFDLAAEDANTRREAAYWLGERGALEATSELVQVYENDADKRVRIAARDALGMFRAIEKEFNRARARGEDFTLELSGSGGSGRRVSVATLIRIEVILLISLIALLTLAFTLPATDGDGHRPTQVAAANPTVEDRTQGVIIEETRFMMDRLTNGATTLQTQFNILQNGGEADCAAFVDAPQPYALSEGDARRFINLASLVAQLNDLQAELVEAKTSFDRSCRGLVVLTPASIADPLAQIDAVLDKLPGIADQLEAARATPTPEATVAPTTAPSPTAAQANVRVHLGPLFNIVDTVTGQRGAYTLLNLYWSEVATAGQTDGCNEPVPVIPDGYVLPAIDAQASLELARAVSRVNIGLDLLRQGWGQFATACDTDSLGGNAALGLQNTATALQALEEATDLLTRVRTDL